MGNVVEVRGLAALDKALQKVSEDVAQKIAYSATRAGANVVRKEAISRAPKLTGNLKKNIITSRVKDETLTARYDVRIRAKGKKKDVKNAYYGIFKELGTVKEAPDPFLAPALVVKRDAAGRAMAAVITNSLKKYGLK